MAIDFNTLSEEDKKNLMTQVEADRKRKAEERKAAKETYNGLKNDVVDTVFDYLGGISKGLTEAKQHVFNDFKTLLEMKQELYEISDEAMDKQQSHTFSNEENTKSITIGYNVVDGWDGELVTAGVDRVNKWLDSKTNEENRLFVGMVRDLLKPNKDGMIKASRVLELGKKAREIGDSVLIEGVDMLQDAYKPVKTSTFVKASFKTDKGETAWMALSMSQA